MSANRLYHTWFERIRQLRPDERITRLRNLTWLMVGIYQSRSVHLSDIAGKAEMDAVWCEWIGPPANWPQRACVQAALAPGTLVEITVIAARGSV